jgi:hypothetical protein
MGKWYTERREYCEKDGGDRMRTLDNERWRDEEIMKNEGDGEGEKDLQIEGGKDIYVRGRA